MNAHQALLEVEQLIGRCRAKMTMLDISRADAQTELNKLAAMVARFKTQAFCNQEFEFDVDEPAKIGGAG